MYTLNAEHTEKGIKVTIPQDPTNEESGTEFAFIKYIPPKQQSQNDSRRWLVMFDETFESIAHLDCHTFHNLDAAQYLVLAAYHEYKASK